MRHSDRVRGKGDARIIIHIIEEEARGLVIIICMCVQFVFLLSIGIEGAEWVDDFKHWKPLCTEFAYWVKWTHREE